jgi:hypothetical protein
MKNTKILSWRLAALIALAMAAPAWAQQPTGPVVNSTLQKVQATVAAIDPGSRTVTLKGPQGLVNVAVSPDVHNFDKLHVGDTVTVSYYQGIAAQIKKGGTKVTAPAGAAFTTPAQNGARPGGGVGESVTTMVTVLAVDPSTNSVSFKRSDGSVHVIAVQSPKMQNFVRTLKPGDVVEVTYTESVAIDVTPAS